MPPRHGAANRVPGVGASAAELVRVAAALALMAACGDEPVTPSAAAPRVTLADTTGWADPATPPADLCDRLPVAAGLGAACGAGAAACENGALCVPPLGGGAAACAQFCVPPADPSLALPIDFDATLLGCDTCDDGQRCVTLLDDAGSPVVLDLNLDGQADVLAGACLGNVAGNRPAWAACGAEGLCEATAACLRPSDRATGTCLPLCETRCDSVGGVRARCSQTGAGVDVCLVACDPSAATPCPDGLTCAPTEQGAHTCVR